MIGFLQTAKDITLLFISKTARKPAAYRLSQCPHIFRFLKSLLHISQTVFQFKNTAVFLFSLQKFCLFLLIFLYFFLQHICIFFQSVLPSHTAFSLTGQKNQTLHTVVQTILNFFIIRKRQLFPHRVQKTFQFPDF